MPDLPSSTTAVLAEQSREEEKENPGRPREKKGGRRRRKREERNGPGNASPRSPKNPAAFSPQMHQNKASKKQKQLHEIDPIQNQSSLPKIHREHDPKKSRTLKREAKMERTFNRGVFGLKARRFWGKNFLDKSPNPGNRVHHQKSPKKAKTRRTLKNRQNRRESLQKKFRDKNGRHFPLNSIKKTKTFAGLGEC